MEQTTIFCLASYEKGHEFLREAKRQGARVILLTSLGLEHKAHWPRESIDEIFYMPDKDGQWNRQDTLNAVSYLARTRAISRIVPLDDFDVEVAAMLREHLRVPGMGESVARHFRDKLTMRMEASRTGIRVPRFIHVLNHEAVAGFTNEVAPPWVLKPRSMAGAIGIKKVWNVDELWRLVHQLGDLQSHYLLEQFIPGDVYHIRRVFTTAVAAILSKRDKSTPFVFGRFSPPGHAGNVNWTKKVEITPWVVHDLRRTVATGMIDIGVATPRRRGGAEPLQRPSERRCRHLQSLKFIRRREGRGVGEVGSAPDRDRTWPGNTLRWQPLGN